MAMKKNTIASPGYPKIRKSVWIRASDDELIISAAKKHKKGQ